MNSHRLRMSIAPAPDARGQQGVALIVGLIILVVLALLGASAYSVATQDERIAGNARDRALAMDAAETMLRYCENLIQGGALFDGSTPGFVPAPSTPGTLWLGDQPTAWSGATNQLPNYQSINPRWSTAPQCIAEQFPAGSIKPPLGPGGLPVGTLGNGTSSLNVARVTARGYGQNTNTAVTVVSYISW
jgi:type IV pilus assembly protein PilX